MSPEDVIFLLFEKRLPNRQESQDFRHELVQRAERLPTGALRVLESLTPGSGHPMDWLSIGIQSLGVAETTGDIRADGLNLISRMPELMATIFRLRGGRGLPEVASEPERGMVENFVHLLGLEGADAERMIRTLREFSSSFTWITVEAISRHSPAKQLPAVGPACMLPINLKCDERSFRSASRSCQSILP